MENFIIKYRHISLIVILIVTGFFGFKAAHVSMYTAFEDLLPYKHPYIKVHHQFKEVFGGANIIGISVQRKKGDIYNLETLSKIKKITEAVELTTGVNNYQIFSIARQKVKDIRATTWGVELKPIMWPDLPETEEEIKALKQIIQSNNMVHGQLVSKDDTAALITATFLEERIDYSYIFNRLKPFCASLEDENTSIYIAGEPILYGWIYYHLKEISYLFVFTLFAMVGILVIFTQRVIGVLMPLISALASSIWGLGFMGILGYNFDPLIVVVPFLISARTISHSVQMNERYVEEHARLGDKKRAAAAALKGLIKPGFLSIMTDAAGVLIISVAPIPLLVKLAFVGSFWVMSNIFTVLFLNPLLYTYIPAPKHTKKEVEVRRLTKLLSKTGEMCCGSKAKWIIVGFASLLGIWSVITLKNLTIGDVNPGSPLLWPDSSYNQSVKHINEKFPGLDQLMVIIEGAKEDVIKSPAILRTMEDFSRFMLNLPQVGGASSAIQLLKKLSMVLHYDHPYWNKLPVSSREASENFLMIHQSSEPGDLDKWVTNDFKNANITLFLKDHRGDTIRKAIGMVKEFIEQHPLQDAEFRLAGGLIGILAGANEVMSTAHEWNLFLILSFTFLCCAAAYRSLLAGFLFIASLLLANSFTLAIMTAKGIGLNVNSLPVISLGIGLGVDYGLYIVNRIIEEYRRAGDLKAGIVVALSTAGKAVLITAITMVTGIIFWYFSPLRFQAEMGVLLTIVLVMNLLGGMLLLPALIALIKPGFVMKGLKTA